MIHQGLTASRTSPSTNNSSASSRNWRHISSWTSQAAKPSATAVIYIMKDRVWGLFGDEDTLAHFEPFFLKHYMNSHHFPGGHTPTAEQFKTWYCPLIEKLLIISK